jgi:putative endopeptidase
MKRLGVNGGRVSRALRVAAALGAISTSHTPAFADTILFVGNSFTYAALSPIQNYRPETVTDLNQGGASGVAALFKAFTRQAGLSYDVSLETAGSMNLDFHYEQKARLIARPWDHVILQPYSTLDSKAPGDARVLIEYAGQLAELFHAQNPSVDVRLVATWSRADQTYLPSGHWFGRRIDAMARDLRLACDRAAVNSPYIQGVIPVGQAWIRAMDTSVATANPYQAARPGELNLWGADGYHGSTYGYYLEALVIFGSVTGRDPRSLGRHETAATQLGINAADTHALQRVAFETLAAETRRRHSRGQHRHREPVGHEI